MSKQRGPLDVVVANLNAKTLLHHHGVLYTLRQMCNGDTYLLLSTSIEGMCDELNGIMLRRGLCLNACARISFHYRRVR